MNLQKCIDLLKKEQCDALLLCDEKNMHYLCGFSPSEGIVVVTESCGYHIVDSRYTETAQLHSKDTGLCVTEINSDLISEVSCLLKKHNCSRILFEDKTISYDRYCSLRNGIDSEFVPMGNTLMDMRNIKEQYEIDMIKAANNIAEKSFLELLNYVKAGISEKELAAQFDYIMAKNGSYGISFDTILLTGAHTSMPHGIPDDRKIKNNDFILFDFGATYKGYHSDMTRTVVVGKATDEMVQMYDLVLRAQEAGIKSLNAGVKCSDVYKAAYDVLAEKNTAQYFRHSLGHGVGLDIHEGYNASPKSDDVYKIGNVTSIEPGIYIPGKFGIRIEDLLWLSPKGRENLSTVTKNLIEL